MHTNAPTQILISLQKKKKNRLKQHFYKFCELELFYCCIRCEDDDPEMKYFVCIEFTAQFYTLQKIH